MNVSQSTYHVRSHEKHSKILRCQRCISFILTCFVVITSPWQLVQAVIHHLCIYIYIYIYIIYIQYIYIYYASQYIYNQIIYIYCVYLYHQHSHTALNRPPPKNAPRIPGSHRPNVPKVGSFENAVSRQFLGWFLVVKPPGSCVIWRRHSLDITKQWVKIVQESWIKSSPTYICEIRNVFFSWTIQKVTEKMLHLNIGRLGFQGYCWVFDGFSMTMFYIGIAACQAASDLPLLGGVLHSRLYIVYLFTMSGRFPFNLVEF